jgi:hypothetical protein
VSAASLPLPSGAATSALQGAGLPGALTGGGGVKVGLVDALPAGANSIGTVVSTNAAASQADGHSASIGSTADADSALTLIGRIKNLLSRIPAALGAGGGLKVDGSGTALPVSAASLPLPSGASTAAKQPDLGIAGTASADVITVQGIAGGTALPVSGSITATVTGVATSTIQTDGTQKAIARGGAKGATTAADVTSTASGANHNSLDVINYDASGNVIFGTAAQFTTGGASRPTAGFVNAVVGGLYPNALGGADTLYPLPVTSTGLIVEGRTSNGSALGAERPLRCGGTDGTNARTILTDTSGRQVMVGTSIAGSVSMVVDPIHLGAFGDIVAEQKTPLFGKNFGSNVFVDQLDSRTIVTSGVVDINGNRLRLQTGTTSGASALYNSVKIATYREGQGMQLRFTAAFTTGVANSTQIVGAFTPDFADGYGFGYNGTSFAIFHRNGGADSTVANTYPLAQGSWNGNVPSGFDPTKGNVYRIDYPFLGYGDIRFYIQDSTTGSVFLAHTIRYANATTTIQLAEPALQFCARVLSVSSTTNLTMFVGSYAAFCVGERLFNGPQWSRGNVVNGVTTLAQIIAIRNCTSFNTKTNKRIARVRLFSTSADNGNTTAQFRWFIGPTVGGAPAFTPFNGTTGDNGVTLTSAQSILSFDIAGTTITGGDEIFGTLLSRNNSSGPIDATLLNLIILPGQTLVIGASAGATTNVGVSLNGNED